MSCKKEAEGALGMIPTNTRTTTQCMKYKDRQLWIKAIKTIQPIPGSAPRPSHPILSWNLIPSTLYPPPHSVLSSNHMSGAKTMAERGGRERAIREWQAGAAGAAGAVASSDRLTPLSHSSRGPGCRPASTIAPRSTDRCIGEREAAAVCAARGRVY